MAHIEHSFLLGDNGLMLSKNDAKIILPIVKKALASAERNYEKYQDIVYGGDATERQQDKLVEAESTLRFIQGIIPLIKEFIK